MDWDLIETQYNAAKNETMTVKEADNLLPSTWAVLNVMASNRDIFPDLDDQEYSLALNKLMAWSAAIWHRSSSSFTWE